ncbi:MAG: hypothetical protein RJA22_2795 [Verrucomicrobiota bacterium]
MLRIMSRRALACPWSLLAFLFLRLSVAAATVQLDPVAPLTNATVLGAWSGAGLDGWEVSQVAGVVTGLPGLSGTASGTTPQVSRTNLAGGPDLDLGYNDYLEFLLQLPAGYAGEVRVWWGTTNAAGFAAARSVTLGGTNVGRDGLPHTYRIDLSLEPGWTGLLRDLRVEPFGSNAPVGAAFTLAAVRVGDVGPDYLPNYLFYPAGAAGVNDAVSKHFRIVYGNSNATWLTDVAYKTRGNLRNMEDQFALYTKVLKYREPTESNIEANRNGTRYKVNLVVGLTGLSQHQGGGYFMGYDGGTGFGYLIIDPSGLRVDPPSWVNPHELGHVFQVHQRGGYVNNGAMGFWWEAHANWFREQYLKHPLYPGSPDSGFGTAFPNNAHFYHAHGRHYYDHWPIFEYLEENPDNLPQLGPGFTARLWQESLAGEYIYNTIARLAPSNSIKDILGLYVRRNVTWDYRNQAQIWQAIGIGPSLNYSAAYVRRSHTELRRRADEPSWWEVPPEMAPMQGAYNIVELAPSNLNSVVTVNFRGLPALGRTADFRVALVAVNTNTGAARYSGIWSNGTGSLTLGPGDARLFLTVAATPGDFIPQEADEARFPYNTHPARMRFLYEAQITGAAPRPYGPVAATNGLVQHANGGGWKASTATVDASAYVGPNARVLNTAQVRGSARVEDFAVVENSAQVRDRAVVSGQARVRDSARVIGRGKVRDFGEARDSAVVSGQGRVWEHATVAETLAVTNQGAVKGFAYAWDDPNGMRVLGGSIDGDYAAGHTCSNATLFGWLCSSNYAHGRGGAVPDGLFSSFEFDRAHPSLAEDRFGVNWGILRGAPAWAAAEAGRPGVLRFRGSNDFITLPRAAADHEDLTLAAWVKWDGGAAGQRLFELGADPGRRLWLTPNDGLNRLLLSANHGSVQPQLSAPMLATGVWQHVAVTLGGDVATLYVNGLAVATGPFTVNADDLMAPNTVSAPQANYVGRGQEGDYLRATLDEVRVYARALNVAEVANLSVPPPQTLVSTGAVWRYHDLAQNLGTAWRSNSFNDAGWSNGAAQLGFGDADEATVIADRDQPTVYFRRTFVVADPAAVGSLTLRVLRDDGAVAYLNGVEVFRSNMPTGTITYATLASGSVPAADETTTFYATPISPALLVAGTNVLAVEVHQNSTTSSDLSFMAELVATGAAPLAVALDAPVGGMTYFTDQLALAATTVPGVTQVVFLANGTVVGVDAGAPYGATWSGVVPGTYTLVARACDAAGRCADSMPATVTVVPPPLTLAGAGGRWRYHDLGTNLGTAWRGTNHDDTLWAEGPAMLGFGDANGQLPVTLLSNRAQLTFYFRRTFAVTNTDYVTNLLLRLQRDDGAVVYLNETEVWRNNLPGPPTAITFTTPASGTVPQAEENAFITTNASPGLLRPGLNVLAVEVHNASTTSSDIAFDFELVAQRGLPAATPTPLGLAAGQGAMTLSWADAAGPFVLMTATNLGPGAAWSPVGAVGEVSNGVRRVTLPMGPERGRFYRLQAP